MLEQAIKKLTQKIKEDYIRMATHHGREKLTGYYKDQVDNFEDQTTVKEGKKYIKIVRDNTVWGFIVKNDFKHFRKGDILKAAGFNAPALNQARGNILDDDYSIAWTGPHYLK
jgi:hypothetical protein|tara:strand:- start:1318 stop:1656 length:339 start_codon:yes stop_codon:yes gene_type:complete